VANTRTRAPRTFAPIPLDFPHPHRSGGTGLFQAVLGGLPKSTLHRWLADGVIPKPTRIGGLNYWPETVMDDVRRNGTKSPASASDAQSADAALS
jgi:hypothetical protein